MRPKLRHRICARPMAICWCIGALMLWIPTTVGLWNDEIFPAALTDLPTILLLLLGYAALGGVGFFVGTLPLFWLVVRVCRRINGGPYFVGDRVTILTGPNAGITTTIYEFTRGQGGDLLARVELGAVSREKYLDIREDYTLLRTSSRKAAFHDAPSEPNVA